MSEKVKAVVLDGYTLNPGDLDWAPLKAFCDLKVYDKTNPNEVISRCAGAQLIFTNKVPITKTVIDALPALKYIGVIATGYNVVDIKYAAEKNITVTNVPAYSTDSVAQLVFAFILELCCHVGKHSDEVHAGKWTKCEHFCYHSFPLHELTGKTLGIFGFGNIGRRVMEIGLSFGMKVIISSRSKKDLSRYPSVKQVDLNTLLSTADFISLNAPLTDETRFLINEKSLAQVKKSACIINTARGPLIDEAAVAKALKEQKLAGYAADVLSTEPPAPDNSLIGAPNCLLTPHIAWQTTEARARLLAVLAENAQAFLQGKTVNKVN